MRCSATGIRFCAGPAGWPPLGCSSDSVHGLPELSVFAGVAIEDDQRMMRFEWLQGEPGKGPVP